VDWEGAAKVQLLEAAYFAEKGVLALDSAAIMKAALKKDKIAKEKFMVIKNLRDLGYITRVSLEKSDYLRIHRKGFRPDAERTYYLVKVVTEKWKQSLKEMQEDLSFAGKLRKELVIAIVGKDRLQFIRFGRINFE
jgi:tRNA splicing endonuclease